MSLLASQFAYKAWAGRELFAAVARLPEATRHPLLRVLNHIRVVDGIFMAHLQGQPHGFAATNTPETPSLEVLASDQASIDTWFADQLPLWDEAAMAEALQFRFTDGDTGCMTRAEILQHLLAHGAYHRGAVGQMLRDAGQPPPRDLFTRYLHETEPQRRHTR